LFKIIQIFTEFILHKGETAARDLNQESRPVKYGDLLTAVST